jgi:hypothetical protein
VGQPPHSSAIHYWSIEGVIFMNGRQTGVGLAAVLLSTAAIAQETEDRRFASEHCRAAVPDLSVAIRKMVVGNDYVTVHMLHAPKGKLDANDKLFKAMISSIRPEPKWQSYSNEIIAKLYNAEAQKEAVQDQAIADFQRHVADTVNSVTANQMRGANNSAFGADQNIRGVQTFRDPTTGSTMELSNLYDHAWLNRSNEYIMSDDPNFNPNGQLTGNWNQLQPVRPAP